MAHGVGSSVGLGHTLDLTGCVREELPCVTTWDTHPMCLGFSVGHKSAQVTALLKYEYYWTTF